MKITHPIEGHTGTTEVGPYSIEFKDGSATRVRREGKDADLNDGAEAYLVRKGYGVGSKAARAPEDVVAEVPDPRKVGDEQVGDRLRDGAVDPREGDFLAPTNAGEANPHGPAVVSPELHASEGVRPVKPGVVHVDDPAAQDAAESEHAAKATDGTPIDDAIVGDDEELKGAALDDALEAAGLPRTGTADEKRARLAEHAAKA